MTNQSTNFMPSCAVFCVTIFTIFYGWRCFSRVVSICTKMVPISEYRVSIRTQKTRIFVRKLCSQYGWKRLRQLWHNASTKSAVNCDNCGVACHFVAYRNRRCQFLVINCPKCADWNCEKCVLPSAKRLANPDKWKIKKIKKSYRIRRCCSFIPLPHVFSSASLTLSANDVAMWKSVANVCIDPQRFRPKIKKLISKKMTNIVLQASVHQVNIMANRNSIENVSPTIRCVTTGDDLHTEGKKNRANCLMTSGRKSLPIANCVCAKMMM